MKIKKAITGVVLFLMCAAAISAAPFNLSEKDYQAMIEKAIVSTGNNVRMKKTASSLFVCLSSNAT